MKNKKYKLHLLISIIIFIVIIHLTIPFSIYKIYWPLYIIRVLLVLDIIYIIISASLVYVNREIKEQKKTKKVKETIRNEKNITEDENQLYEEIDEMLAWDKQECEFVGRKQPRFPESGYDMVYLQKLRDTELQPYLDKMGNCELVLLPGIHCIYDQRPEDVADIIRDFLDRIEE